MKRVIKQKMEDGSLQVVSQSITVPIAEWQALKKKVEEGTLYNTEEIITESGTWTAKVTGWHEILLIGGGSGCYIQANVSRGVSGTAGRRRRLLVWLEKGQDVSVTIGSGGLGNTAADTAALGGDTVFNGFSSSEGDGDGWSPNQVNIISEQADFNGTGPNSTRAWGVHGTPSGHHDILDGKFPGGGAGGRVELANNFYGFGNGAQGAVIARWYEPAKS